MSRERVKLTFAASVIVFTIFLILQKVLHVQDGGTSPAVWWIVAVGKLVVIVGIVVFGLWTLKLKFSEERS